MPGKNWDLIASSLPSAEVRSVRVTVLRLPFPHPHVENWSSLPEHMYMGGVEGGAEVPKL